MHPILFHIGPFEAKMYGLMLAMGFLTGIAVAAFIRAPKLKIPSALVVDTSLVVLITSIIGSRLFYVVTHWSEFSRDLSSTVSPFHAGGLIGMSGLSMMGGVVLASICGPLFIWLRKGKVLLTSEIMFHAYFLGVGFTRIGCFFNGCCYGEPTQSFLGVIFPPDCPAGSHYMNIPLMPVQLFESAFGFGAFFFLWWLERWRRWDGFTLFNGFILYGLWRTGIDLFRTYEPGNYLLFHLTDNQWLCVVLITVGVVGHLVQWRKYAVKPNPS